MKKIESCAIVGMGALGMLFGDEIITSLGQGSVQYVADADRVARYAGKKFTVNGREQQFPVVAGTDATPADLVIVAVKYNALPAALDTMAGCVGPDTTIISVMNGITSEKVLGERFGAGRVIYTIAQGMDAMKFGTELTFTKPGGLRIGLTDGVSPERFDALTEYLTRAGVPFVVEEDVLHRLWGKFMLNVGINQCCMAYETGYAGVLNTPAIYDVFIGAMKEVQALAACEGVTLTDADIDGYVALMGTLSPEGMPSMRQDGVSHRPSEVEMFAGTVCRMAAEHGLAVPVNTMLYNKIKAMEAAY